MKNDAPSNKRTIILLITVAALHFLASLFISIYHGNIAGKQVGYTISKAINVGDITDKEIQNLKVNFEENIKPTYYLAFALSLPFGPIFQPLHKEWIVEPLLNHQIGQDKFKQRIKIISGIELFSNAIFFSLIFFYIWKLVWKLKVHLIK
jgi:hypothetical protein